MLLNDVWLEGKKAIINSELKVILYMTIIINLTDVLILWFSTYTALYTGILFNVTAMTASLLCIYNNVNEIMEVIYKRINFQSVMIEAIIYYKNQLMQSKLLHPIQTAFMHLYKSGQITDLGTCLHSFPLKY